MLYKADKQNLCFLVETRLIASLLFSLLLCFFSSAYASPYIPKNDSEILERLPSGLQGRLSYELRSIKNSLSREPNNLKLALEFAKRCIETSRTESDPRYLGYAEAALMPWLREKDPPLEVLVLRATIRQSNHDFKSALEDLSKALAEDRYNAQAWLTKAAISQAIGDYAGAKHSCLQLLPLTSELVTVACASNVGSVNGTAKRSFEILSQTVKRNTDISKDEKIWAITIIADIANRIGDYVNSEKYFKEAIALNPNDNYLLTLYSDFLLDQKRPKEVIELLKNKIKVDSLILRLALAEKKLALPEAKAHIQELKARFTASHLRGDTVHQREEAIFNLKLLDNPKKALELSKKNWEIQKEPIDARIFLESAIASNNKSSVKPLLEFLEKNKLEDRKMATLVEKLGRMN